METTVINVKGMSCEHCVRSVTGVVTALPGVSGVTVNLKAGTVTVKRDPGKADISTIITAIEDQGYEAEE